MRTHFLIAILLAFALPAFAEGENNGYAVMKVNHEFLNDAGETHSEIGDLTAKARYQQTLEKSGKYTGIRFIVHWKAPSSGIANFVVKIEARGLDAGSQKENIQTLLKTYPRSESSSGWEFMDITDDTLKRFGKLMAWKVTLLSDGKPMAERHSFMWDDTILGTEKTTETK